MLPKFSLKMHIPAVCLHVSKPFNHKPNMAESNTNPFFDNSQSFAQPHSYPLFSDLTDLTFTSDSTGNAYLHSNDHQDLQFNVPAAAYDSSLENIPNYVLYNTGCLESFDRLIGIIWLSMNSYTQSVVIVPYVLV